MERENWLKGMLEFCYKDKKVYKTMINKMEKELKEIESSRIESKRVS